MLSHSQQQDEARLAAAQAAAVNQHSLHSHQPQQNTMHNDLMLKLQQAQLQQQQKQQLDMLGKCCYWSQYVLRYYSYLTKRPLLPSLQKIN